MENNKKIKPITVRFDEGDFNKLIIDSKEKGMNISEYVRSIVREHNITPEPVCLPELPCEPNRSFNLKELFRRIFKLVVVKQK